MDAFDREEQCMEDDYNAGNISLSEYRKQMKGLQRDFKAAAEESAHNEYNNEFERW